MGAAQERYPVGSVVRGSIRNITNFGVFIGIEEGIDGLIHVSDLTWSSKLKNPADAFEKGQELEAVVLNIDAEKERFSLGVKQLTMDPWDNVESRYPVGSVVETKITKTLDFGAIVAIDDDTEAHPHLELFVSDVVKEGDTVRAKVINLIPHERKIGLSLKQISEEEASDEYSQYIKQQRAEQSTTLGDLIGSKLFPRTCPCRRGRWGPPPLSAPSLLRSKLTSLLRQRPSSQLRHSGSRQGVGSSTLSRLSSLTSLAKKL